MRFPLMLGGLTLWACASYECGFLTCPQGCCALNVCYEGTGVKNGLTCGGTGGGAGGGMGGGMGGGSSGGGVEPCPGEGQACSEGGTQCCALNAGGEHVACVYQTCRACITSGRCDSPPQTCCNGTCDSQTGYCASRCGYYSEPCNDSEPCCKSFSGSSNGVCRSERCSSCTNPGAECDPKDPYATRCCAGLRCALKPGFTSVYVCRQ